MKAHNINNSLVSLHSLISRATVRHIKSSALTKLSKHIISSELSSEALTTQVT